MIDHLTNSPEQEYEKEKVNSKKMMRNFNNKVKWKSQRWKSKSSYKYFLHIRVKLRLEKFYFREIFMFDWQDWEREGRKRFLSNSNVNNFRFTCYILLPLKYFRKEEEQEIVLTSWMFAWGKCKLTISWLHLIRIKGKFMFLDKWWEWNKKINAINY